MSSDITYEDLDFVPFEYQVSDTKIYEDYLKELFRDRDSDEETDSNYDADETDDYDDYLYIYNYNRRKAEHDTACIGFFFVLSVTVAILSVL
jgi:hypothetical protein